MGKRKRGAAKSHKSPEELSRQAYKAEDKELFVRLVREYFSSVFSINYSYTYEDLDAEIKKKKLPRSIKRRVSLFTNKMNKWQYGDFSDKQLDEMVQEFKMLSDALNGIKHFHIRVSSKGLLFLRLIKKIIALVIVKFLRAARPVAFSSDIKLYRLRLRISESRSFAKSGDFNKASRAYRAALAIYGSLPERLKKEVYDEVSSLYACLKSKGLDHDRP